MFKFLLAGFVGFIIGVVLTCILLCKKNLETYKQIENKVSSNRPSLKDSIENAKALYKAQVEAYENGGSLGSEEELLSTDGAQAEED